jgi:hypothetical protein
MVEISPLRRQMIEDMTVRNLSPATQQSYLSAISKFSRYDDDGCYAWNTLIDQPWKIMSIALRDWAAVGHLL